MAKRKKGSGGSFATNFLGPTTHRSSRSPNYGQGHDLAAAGKRKRKTSKGIYGAVNRRAK